MGIRGRSSAVVAAAFWVATLVAPDSTGASPIIVEFICGGRTATIVGTDGDDRLKGTDGSDVIIGRAGDDVIRGLRGNDLICGGTGNDTLDGNSGHDTLLGAGGRDDADGGFGNDLVVGADGIDILRGGDSRFDSDTVVGGDGNDYLEGGDGRYDADYLFGGKGNDGMDGGDGSQSRDMFFPGPGFDRVDGGAGGNDILSFVLQPGPVHVELGVPSEPPGEDYVGIENVIGTAADDVLIGDATGNVLRGGAGDDVVRGGPHFDSLDGGAGSDVIDSGNEPHQNESVSFMDSPNPVSASLLTGSATSDDGTDSLSGFGSVSGSAYLDVLEGDDLDNTLGTFFGADRLLGLGGDDTLYSPTEGSDAGAGNDICWQSNAANCEQFGHGDPAPSTRITYPGQASVLSRGEFASVQVEVVPGLGPSPSRIEVALRLFSNNGCSWWSERRENLVRRACGRPLWNREVSAGGRLPAGVYQALSRADLPEGYPSFSRTRGKDLIEFRLVE